MKTFPTKEHARKMIDRLGLVESDNYENKYVEDGDYTLAPEEYNRESYQIKEDKATSKYYIERETYFYSGGTTMPVESDDYIFDKLSA